MLIALALVRQMRPVEAAKRLMVELHISRSQAYVAVGEARKLQAREYERVPKAEHASNQIARLERVADLAERDGQWRAAVAAIREMIRITGTAAPTKGDVTHTHTGHVMQVHAKRMVELSEAELRLLALVDREEVPAEPVAVAETEH